MSRTTRHILAAIALLIVSYLLFPVYFKLVVSLVKTGTIYSKNITGVFQERLFFSFIIGTIPVLKLLVEIGVKHKSLKQSLFIFTLVLLSVVSLLGFRISQLNDHLEWVDSAIKNLPKSPVTIEDLHLNSYLISGLLSGFLLSFLSIKLFLTRKN